MISFDFIFYFLIIDFLTISLIIFYYLSVINFKYYFLEQ